MIPRSAIAAPGLEAFLIAAAIAVVAAFLLVGGAMRAKQLFEKGNKVTVWPYVGGLVGLPLAILIFG